jgi:ligand-binding sensor domain-containing protein
MTQTMISERPVWLFLFFNLFLLTHSNVKAQDPEIYFKRLRTEDGLSHNKINCMLQDNKGFMWIGTEDGLDRYDGRFFTVFRNNTNDTSNISGNIITDLHEDRRGILWIATQDGGITRYDHRLPQQKQFRQFKYEPGRPRGIPENNIRKIAEDPYGNLWLASSRNYVIRLNTRTGVFDVPVRTGSKSILSLQIDNDTLWVARESQGLMKIDTRTLGYREMAAPAITSLYKDEHNNMWCGTDDQQLYCYYGANRNVLPYNLSPADKINAFTEAGNKLWIAEEHSGVTLFDKWSGNFTNYRNDPFKDGSVADDHTNTVYADRSGTIWIGTDNGLSIYNPLFYPFKKYYLEHPGKDLKIYDFYKDEAGLWIGTSDGIYLKKPGQKGYEHRQLTYNGNALAVSKFYKDVDGTFYIGTDYSLFAYDMAHDQLTLLPNTDKDPVMKKLISSRIVSIVRDTVKGHPVLVTSPYGHNLMYYDLVDQQWAAHDVKDHVLPKFYKDKGGLWIGTSSFGLARWQPGRQLPIMYYLNEPGNKWSISNNYVYDIEGDGHRLWISTYGGGLNSYDETTGRFSHVPYSSNLTEGMRLDNKGNLWMICNGHIHKYEPAVSVYSCYDLPSLQRIKGLSGYIYKDADGNMYAAGDDYYIMFNPEVIRKVDYAPQVYLTDFRIFEDPHAEMLSNKTIHLDYTQNYFSFSFSAPDYSGDNIQYAYKLEGFDKDWMDGGRYNTARYSNLPGGIYHFKVQARNWKGNFSGPYKTIEIVITPPFWYQWWFYLFLLLLCILIAYGVGAYRMSETRKHARIRNGIARDLHDQIGSTLSSIAVYAEVARIYHKEQQDGEHLTKILGSITDSANEMTNEMGDIVWALNPKNDHYSSIVKRVETFARPLCAARGINFMFTCDPDLMTTNLGMKERKDLFLIIKEAVNNAIKYAGCKHLHIRMRKFGQQIMVEVMDDGAGFDAALLERQETGNGLHNMKQRAQELNGKVKFDSEPGKGSNIVLTFNYSSK